MLRARPARAHGLDPTRLLDLPGDQERRLPDLQDGPEDPRVLARGSGTPSDRLSSSANTDGDRAEIAVAEILVTLLARGPLTRAQVRPGTGLAAATVERALADLLRSEAIAEGAGGRLALTDEGRSRARAAAARDGRDLAEEVRRLHAGFLPLDRRVKEAVTRWQIRSIGGVDVPNDHRDPEHDRAVVDDLEAIVSAATALLAPLGRKRARYRRYAERLEEAATRVRAGEKGRISGLGDESIHSIWWQLHADLLAVLGRTRGAAEA